MAAEPLTHAAAARHRRAVERAERALCDLDAEGVPITFQGVARRASVWSAERRSARSCFGAILQTSAVSSESGGISQPLRDPSTGPGSPW